MWRVATVRRRLWLVVPLAAVGCLWTPKPYANDPIIRGRRLAAEGEAATHVGVTEPSPPKPVDGLD